MTTTSIESSTDKLVEELMSLIKRVVGVILVGFFMKSVVKRL